MPVINLETQLQEDVARNIPPFGAESVQIARELGSDATDQLLKHIEAKGKTALLALEAWREADPDRYATFSSQIKAQIYVNALQNNLFYNTWGVPGFQLTQTAYALIALGDEAISTLKPLLDDQKPALLSGSRDATTSTMYGNRVCDYAWVFISEIKKLSYQYLQHPTARDREIERLRQKLESEKKQK